MTLVVAVYPVSAKPQKPAVVVAVTQYYMQVGRKLTASNRHRRTLQNFAEQLDTLAGYNEQDNPDVPKVEPKWEHLSNGLKHSSYILYQSLEHGIVCCPMLWDSFLLELNTTVDDASI